MNGHQKKRKEYWVSASTDLVWEENGFDEEFVLGQMLDYLGVSTYHVTLDPQDTYLKHIDTWGKFLDVDKVLIAQVPPGNVQYDDHEAVADYFANATSAWGTPYQVFRVFTPSGEPYTNSLIVNDQIYVPIENPTWDDVALDVYRAAMPGYEVRGFTGSWLSTDALHCRVKGIADRDMLHVGHQPLAGEVTYQPEVTLGAEIIPYSGDALVEEELFLIYRTDDAPFDTLALASLGEDRFAASLPLPSAGGEVSYYFSATDASGQTAHFPLVGPAAPRSFTALPLPVANEATPTDLNFGIDAVYPNPSAGAVTVQYRLEVPGALTLEVLDLLGRRIALLHDGPAQSGMHEVTWTPEAVPSGIYVVRVEGPAGRASRRLVLTR